MLQLSILLFRAPHATTINIIIYVDVLMRTPINIIM